MKKKELASLKIWNNKSYIIPVLNFLDSIVVQFTNLNIARYHRMRFTVEEMLRYRIKNAYPNSKGTLDVKFYLTDTFFEISVQDKGVPVWQDFSYNKEHILDTQKDFKNYLLDVFVDGSGIEKLGKNGQRCFVQLRIKNPIKFKKPQPYPEIEVLDTDISIRQVTTEEDAIEAIRCIYSEYGYSYSYERLYYIDSFMKMLRNKEIMSFLAVNKHGQIAGHFILAFSEFYKNMPEISTVVIRKEFRGLKLFSKFIDYCINLAKKHNFRAIMGQPVGFHVMSQKAFIKAGFTATSLLLSYLGSDLESEYNKNYERLSLCVSIKIIDPNAQTKIYPPEELKLFIKKLYDKLAWNYELCEDFKLAKNTKIYIEGNEPLKVTKIFLSKSSEDLEHILNDAINETIKNKREMIELFILLNSPSCNYGYQTAKNCGFVLSGLIPGGENGDYLVMQKLMGSKFEYDNLVLTGEFEELKKDIVSLINQ